ncbi:MAG TPA: phage integrase N-terminal domain-containing protein [Candidatus Tripitaka californicus]
MLRKFAELERHLAQIQEITPITVEAYSKDWKVQRVAERTLQNESGATCRHSPIPLSPVTSCTTTLTKILLRSIPHHIGEE